jgi:hypothetical protein
MLKVGIVGLNVIGEIIDSDYLVRTISEQRGKAYGVSLSLQIVFSIFFIIYG